MNAKSELKTGNSELIKHSHLIAHPNPIRTASIDVHIESLISLTHRSNEGGMEANKKTTRKDISDA
jgi:hypothetical protein